MFNYLLTVGCPEFLLTHQTTKVFKTFVVSSLYQQNFRAPSMMKIHGHDTVLIFRVAYNGHNKIVGSLVVQPRHRYHRQRFVPR